MVLRNSCVVWLRNSGPLLTVNGLVRPVITKLDAAECTQYWKEVMGSRIFRLRKDTRALLENRRMVNCGAC